MSGNLNEVNLIGNLTKDPELRATQAGKRIANMTVATNETWKDANGDRKERAEFHRVVIFNETLAGIAEKYLKKGSKIFLRGQLQTRKWTDDKGSDKYSTEVVVQGFTGLLLMLDSARGGDDAQNRQAERTQATQENAVIDDEIPFSWIVACALGSSMLLMQSFGAIPFV